MKQIKTRKRGFRRRMPGLEKWTKSVTARQTKLWLHHVVVVVVVGVVDDNDDDLGRGR